MALVEITENALVNRAAAEMMLLQLLADMLDIQIKAAIDARDKCGIIERDTNNVVERTRVMKQLCQASRKYLSWTRQGGRRNIKEEIGEASDCLRVLLLLCIDKSTDETGLQRIYNLINKRYTSKRNLDMSHDYKTAFGELSQNQIHNKRK